MNSRPTIITLSVARRRIYFRLLIGVFVVAIPLLFLYATGYRFESLTVLTTTGGVYVGAEQSDAEIHINGELVRETGTFRRAFFVQDLKPGMYTVTVSKAGFHSWEKVLEVREHRVTEAQAFNMPQEPLLVLIPKMFANQTADATSTSPTTALPNPLYEEIAAAFATTTATSMLDNSPTRVAPVGTSAARGTSSASVANVATTTVATTTKEFRGMRLSVAGGRVIGYWMRGLESAPFYFCARTGECVDQIALDIKGEEPSHFDFFPGTTDLVIVTLRDGVHVMELDNRSEQNIQPLYLEPGADFRIIEGDLYVKIGASIYKVEI